MWANWVMAVATALAAAAASFASILAAQTYRKDRQHEKRAQAERVAGWMPLYDEPINYVRLYNASTLPVYSVRGWLHPRDWEPIRSGWVTALPPSGAEYEIGWNLGQKQLEKVSHWLKSRDQKEEDSPAMLIELTFRDSAGQWWRRKHQGVLEPIRESDKKRSSLRSEEDIDEDSLDETLTSDFSDESN